MERTHSFGYWLRRRRKALDLTQADLAQRVGCAEVTIQKIEAEERRPSAQVAALLADQLQIPAEERAAFLSAARGERTVDQIDVSVQTTEQAQRSMRTNLPAQLTTLIGREQEVASVAGLLRRADVRLVTLTGPGGIGKTRLAFQAAAELAADFTHGVFFVDLAPIREPALVIGQIAITLGVKEIGGQALLVILKEYLRDKQMLLLLDNFEQVIDTAPLVAELLAAAASLKVLATSREVLKVRGEKELVVPPLALPDTAQLPSIAQLSQYPAVALFVQRALDAKPDFEMTNANAPALAEICARLEGLPLAIELAAARLKLFSPEALLARLSSRLALLSSGPRDLPARQQTIRSTIAWSYDLLNEDEQTLFRRLAVFVGGWTLEAAEAATMLNVQTFERSNVLDGLAALLGKSLVRQTGDGDEPRYTMLETIREYALESLEASGEGDMLRQRHARYYLGWSNDQPGEDDNGWRQRVSREYDNLYAALEWSQTVAGDSELALRLSAVLSPLWGDRGVQRQAIAMLQRTLDHPLGVGRTAVHAEVRDRLANFLGITGNFAAAREQYELALQLAEEHGKPWLQAWILSRLGWLAREQGDSTTAWARLSEGIAHYRQQGEVAGLAWGLTTLAEVAILDEDPARAEALLAESDTVWENDGSNWHALWRAWTLNHRGHAAQLRGDYEQAATLHQQALAIFRSLGEQNFGLPWAYQSLGETALGQGRPDQAERWFHQAIVASRGIGDQVSIVWCLAGVGSAAALDEEPDRAARLWGFAEQLRQSLGCRPAPAARATYERALALVRAQLGQERFATAWTAGQALTLEQAIAEALGDGD